MAKQRRAAGLARFGEPGLLVLAALADGPKHGYAIVGDVESQTGVELGPGTLYGALSKLEDRGLVRALEAEGRRRPYALTDAGRSALAEHTAMWSRFVSTAQQRLEQSS